jgi:hypothetical protein
MNTTHNTANWGTVWKGSNYLLLLYDKLEDYLIGFLYISSWFYEGRTLVSLQVRRYHGYVILSYRLKVWYRFGNRTVTYETKPLSLPC